MILVFLGIVQTILAAIYVSIGFLWTWLGVPTVGGIPWPWVFFLGSFPFTIASIRSHRGKGTVWSDRFYHAAAIWLGFFHIVFLLTVGSAIIRLIVMFLFPSIQPPYPMFALIVVSTAMIITIYALWRARTLTVTAHEVTLPNLPAHWEGRRVVLATDIHVGAVWKCAQSQKLVDLINAQRPEAVFFVGDVFDGPPVDYHKETAPFKEIKALLGVFFVNGNHERYRSNDPYLQALRAQNITILMDEVIDLQGIQLIGVDYASSATATAKEEVLNQLTLASDRPSILLSHVPRFLDVPAKRGISLQLSGHTHGGQLWPFTYLSRLVYRGFDRQLKRFGKLQVVTSTGAGTWGPPLRLGTKSEIVVITLKSEK